jgi:ATP-dependent Lhr-like helicase
MRIDGSGSLIGELDEEFVWERSVGDTFSLGIQSWRIQKFTHNDVFVSPVEGRSAMAPFWRADEFDRSTQLAESIAEFLEWSETFVNKDEFLHVLENRHNFEPQAARALRSLLNSQLAATGTLPHRHRVVVESTSLAHGKHNQQLIVVHTTWGGRVNRPLAYALGAALTEMLGSRPEIIHDDDCLVLDLGHELDAVDVFNLLEGQKIEELLRTTLENTGFFGARFREAAGCSLLLPRAGAGRRTPLWLNRQRAKELLETVRSSDDFPLVIEAWRSCLQDAFDLEILNQRLDEVRRGEIEVRQVSTESPSPFAGHVMWKQTNTLMYEDDSAPGTSSSSLREDLIREVSLSAQLRPEIPQNIVETFNRKAQRTAPGYAPRDPSELVDWVRERIVIPFDEWEELWSSYNEQGKPEDGDLDWITRRISRVSLSDQNAASLVVANDRLPQIATALDLGEDGLKVFGIFDSSIVDTTRVGFEENDWNLSLFLAEWLRSYGPVSIARIESLLDLPHSVVEQALEELTANQTVVVDSITSGSAELEVCDRLNLERLLRLVRHEQKPGWVIQNPDALPLLFARLQTIGTVGAELSDLKRCLESLFCLPAPVQLWEEEILPARLEPYLPNWLDTLFAESDLQWIGCGDRRTTFALEGDRELLGSSFTFEDRDSGADSLLSHFQANGNVRMAFEDLVAAVGSPSSEVADFLWRLAWSGLLTTDSFTALRRGIETGFSATLRDESSISGSHRRARRRFSSWQSSRPFSGAWYRLPSVTEPDNALELEELRRERVRLLLDRYGVVFRQLLERELPDMGWSELFRTLRIMELGGEIVGGRFFNGVPGLQFISHAAIRIVEAGLPEDQVWWINATDPASPCSLGLEDLPFGLPRRVLGNHLVFHGRRLVVTSERRGARLNIEVPPDHPHLADYLGFLKVQLSRQIRPRRFIQIDIINDETAATSPYAGALRSVAHCTRTASGIRLSREY